MDKRVINSQLHSFNTYQMYLREMTTLAENVFEFDGIPEFIDIGYINSTLLKNGAIAWFYDDVIKSVIALPFTIQGSPDIYGRPEKIMARSFNGRYYRRLKKDEFIIMYDNTSRIPILPDICQMAERISMCVRTNDVNIAQQRTPRVWKTTSDKKKSIEDMMLNIDSFRENVIAYESIDLEELECVMAPAPYVADKIDDHLDKLWAEFYRLIGVANLIEQKKERMIKDEMSASQGGTIASRYSRFESRKRAIEQINKKWDTNIEVRYYDGVPTNEKDGEKDVSNVSNVSNISVSTE